MPNVLTINDSTFATGVGNWVTDPSSVPTAIAAVSPPTSPDGNRVAQLTRTGTPPGNGNVVAFIPKAIYPIATGDQVSMEVAYSAPATNAGTGTLACQITVVIYEANLAAGGVGFSVTSAPFTKGDGWHQLVRPEFTVGTPNGNPAAWVGCQVRFFPWTGQGILVGDVAYFSDVFLGVPTVATGGWGVGMVRMGGN